MFWVKLEVFGRVLRGFWGESVGFWGYPRGFGGKLRDFGLN